MMVHRGDEDAGALPPRCPTQLRSGNVNPLPLLENAARLRMQIRAGRNILFHGELSRMRRMGRLCSMSEEDQTHGARGCFTPEGALLSSAAFSRRRGTAVTVFILALLDITSLGPWIRPAACISLDLVVPVFHRD